MLRFGADVSCRFFAEPLALLLHHATVWSAIAGEIVTVAAIEERDPIAPPDTSGPIAVELAIGLLENGHGHTIAAYLRRVLDVAYAIEILDPGVRVVWDPRRESPGHL